MRRFTPQEDDLLRANYLALSLKELGAALNRSETSVWGRLKFLQLKVPREVIVERWRTASKNRSEHGRRTCFKPGHTSHNKGKKMPPEIYEKAKATMFKKGHTPHNMVHNGQPYLYERKRKDGRIERLWWIQEGPYKRSAYLGYLCRQHGINLTGKKPRLKEGFDHSRPPTIEDIEVVTNQQNMRLNSLHRYPPEVVKTIQLKGVLTREINIITKK